MTTTGPPPGSSGVGAPGREATPPRTPHGYTHVRALDGRGALVFSVAVLVVFAYVAYELNTSFSSRARLFGNALIVPALVLAALQVVRELRRAQPLSVPPEAVFTASALVWGTAFFAALWAVGLALTIPLFAFVYLRWAAGEAWPKAGVYALLAWLFVEVSFVRLLHVPLPGGAIPLPGIAN